MTQPDRPLHFVSIVGARPNFIKIAPIAWELTNKPGIRHTIVHTGQHYDDKLSQVLFDVLDIPAADINLEIGSASHGVQTGKIMIALEPVLEKLQPDWVITVGDVNSTAAAALVASKLGIKLAHVEAGLRSFDRTMPEEINRIVTDSLSDLLLVTEQSGLDNLRKEGIPDEKVVFTGNVMIDSLVRQLPKAREQGTYRSLDVEKNGYVLVTLHRPSNVDRRENLLDLMDALAEIARTDPVIFPVHPRTRHSLERYDLWDKFNNSPGLHLTDPLDYLSFLSLTTTSKALVTDSGGIQEESTYLGIPCITLRPNTERPVTIDVGTNELVTPTGKALLEAYRRITDGNWKKGRVPELWDGRAAGRIVQALIDNA